MPVPTQRSLPFGAIRNSELFSSHWLDRRLILEPEWSEQRENAETALTSLSLLWRTERSRVHRYGSEHALEHAFVQPVFRALGWKLIYQPYLRGREPDYALFDGEDSLQRAIEAGRTSPAFWRHPVLVADAKAWHVGLDRPHMVSNQREYPPEQIEWYMFHSALEFGILSNGRLWRLFPRTLDPEQPRFQTYLECDLERVLNAWSEEDNLLTRDSLLDEFLRFFLLFGPTGHAAPAMRQPLTVRARRGSTEYRIGIGEDLRTRVFEALRLAMDGFLHHEANGITTDALDLCRRESFVFLYRLLFVLYAEDRGLLPYGVNQAYTENRSLGRLRDDVAMRLDGVLSRNGGAYSLHRTSLWEDLRTLFDLVDGGNRRYEVTAYNGGLFHEGQHAFLADNAISDWYVARIVDQLSRAEDPLHPGQGAFRVDYRDLRIQHLGSVYETLLELRPRVAELAMENPLTGATIEPGHVYLDSAVQHRTGRNRQRQDRRTTGSFYTPDHIVDHIVAETLRPLCDNINDEIRAEASRLPAIRAESADDPALDAQRLAVERDFDNRVLRLRVLDPAMGSGHFLLSACKYLAEEIATNPYTRHPAVESLGDDSTLLYWKRRVVEHCLYGVDQNPLAVELAKLALWLETAANDQSLTFLDHHLRVGNSLVGATVSELGSLPGAPLIRASVHEDVRSELPSFLGPLDEIARLASNTPKQVKRKERLFRVARNRAKPFLCLAHLWCSSFYRDDAPTDQQYSELVSVLRRPVVLARLTSRREWLRSALETAEQDENRFFHWELEFPEVYFKEASRRVDPGFDAVIGNPPYDVLSELETGRGLGGFRNFIEGHDAYAPTRRGKNNLYKLFLCRAIELLASEGRLGFIVPMALLGDDQAASVRSMLFRQTALTAVEAFPQKDDSNRRVFSEAKLSTVVVTARKTDDGANRTEKFRSRVHPANIIDDESPSVTVSAREVESYDPENRSIVSCSQEDWDLASRINADSRMGRLGDYCAFYQGEVNETRERHRGAVSDDPDTGPSVLRGASVTLYAIREASQGRSSFLDVERFLDGKGETTKAYHFRQERVGFQRSAPQNNFRRIIAAPIPRERYCFDTVSYITETSTELPLAFLLGLLNSKLADWYFRLGSTNSKVNEYQLKNLPCPVFEQARPFEHGGLAAEVLKDVRRGRRDLATKSLVPVMTVRPYPLVLRQVVVDAVEEMKALERDREPMRRRDRSRLSTGAQPFQDFVDHLLFGMAGLDHAEGEGVEKRLAAWL